MLLIWVSVGIIGVRAVRIIYFFGNLELLARLCIDRRS